MVVVRCLILCSKFAKTRFSARLCTDPLGSLQCFPRSPSWIMGESRGREDGRAGRDEREGEGGDKGGGKGKEAGGKGKGRCILLRMKILAAALRRELNNSTLWVDCVELKPSASLVFSRFKRNACTRMNQILKFCINFLCTSLYCYFLLDFE